MWALPGSYFEHANIKKHLVAKGSNLNMDGILINIKDLQGENIMVKSVVKLENVFIFGECLLKYLGMKCHKVYNFKYFSKNIYKANMAKRYTVIKLS